MLPSRTCHRFWVILCHKCVLINVISRTLSCYLPQTKNTAHPPTSDLRKVSKLWGEKMDPNGSQRYNFFIIALTGHRDE